MKGDGTMKISGLFTRLMTLLAVALLTLPGMSLAQSSGETPSKAFSQEQLDQLLAPVALYPDSLLTQVLMASTYPLEVVKAMNWVKKNKDLKGDTMAAALEKQEWDPSVKSLVNFPQVLQMMNDQLDWTQKLGDAFLAQKKDVMGTVQKLRGKAHAAGTLKTTKEQKVVVEKETIIIEPASPQIVYVPTYNPTVVYGVWPYPAYPPYYYYPPGYAAGAAAFGFASGVAVGAAWGYAWGHADWHGGDVDIDINRNANINRNIDRGKYQNQYQNKGQINQSGKGAWQHDAGHRQGVAYRDNATAQKFGQSTGRSAQARSSGDRMGGAEGFGKRDASGGGSPGHGGRESAFSGARQGGFERSASERGRMSRGGGSGASRIGGGGSFGGGRGGRRR